MTWRCGSVWLYSGLSGRWVLSRTTAEVQEGGSFATSAGGLHHPEPHEGQLPHEMAAFGPWRALVSGQWLDDPDVVVDTQLPEVLPSAPGFVRGQHGPLKDATPGRVA